MNDDNAKQIEENTEEILESVNKILFNNDDEFLSRKFLKPYDLNIKTKEFLDDELLPITLNAMFKLMIYNESRIKYSKYLLDFLPEKYRDFTLIKSETDKNAYNEKDMRVDFAALSNDLVINMEMNMSSKIERNVNYLVRLCSMKVRKGEDYKYLKGLQINFNGFKPPHNKVMDLYYTRDRIGNVYLPQIFVNIYLQNLWELYYNVGMEGLSKFERSILVMTSKSVSEAENIAKGVKIMEDYIVDAKKVMESDILKDEYDYIADVAMSSRINGFEEGAEKKTLEIAKEMKKQGYSLEKICSIIKVPMEKISSWQL